MVRAVYDSLALAARDCYEAMGPIPTEIRLTGGAARSEALRTILAASLKVPVRTVDQDEAGAAGACMIAAVAEGVFPDISAASDAWVAPLLCEAQAPDPGLEPVYDALFDAYRAGRDAAPPAWASLAGLREQLA